MGAMQGAPGKQTISANPANNGGARNTIAIDAPARAVVLPLYSSGDGDAGISSLPRRIMVLPWGEVPNANGDRLVVGKRLLEEMAKETYAYGTVALDFEHNTCPGADEYERTAEPRPVAGFGRVVAEEGKGVFLEMERWTPEGLAMAHNYQDVSAVPVTVDDSPEVVAVVSVALCRNGAVPGAEFRESTLSTHQPQNTHKENAMDYKAILITLLGLPADASDEAISEAVEKMNKAGQSPTGHQDSNPDGGVVPLAARIDALERRADKAEKDAILARARAEGRVVALSAEAVAKLSPKDLEETVAKTPATVPLSAVTPGSVRETAAKTPPDEETLKLARMCGVDPEALA